MREIFTPVAIGLLIVGVMLLIGGMMGLPRQQALARAIIAWLPGAAIYTGLRISGGEVSAIGEILKFFPIFGIPAVFAFGISRLLKN